MLHSSLDLLLLLLMFTVFFDPERTSLFLWCLSEILKYRMLLVILTLGVHNVSCDVGHIVWGDEKEFLSQVGLWLLRLVQRLTVDTMVYRMMSLSCLRTEAPPRHWQRKVTSACQCMCVCVCVSLSLSLSLSSLLSLCIAKVNSLLSNNKYGLLP